MFFFCFFSFWCLEEIKETKDSENESKKQCKLKMKAKVWESSRRR